MGWKGSVAPPQPNHGSGGVQGVPELCHRGGGGSQGQNQMRVAPQPDVDGIQVPGDDHASYQLELVGGELSGHGESQNPRWQVRPVDQGDEHQLKHQADREQPLVMPLGRPQ